MEEYLRVGVITSTHGLKGEVKVFPTTDDPARFKKLKQALLKNGSVMKEMRITGVKFFKNQVILKFADHDTIESVMGYKGKELYVTRANAVKLAKDEYFIVDLIGLDVVLEDGSSLGTLTDVLETGANDVYVVQMENQKEVLIPAIGQCILDVDIEGHRMVVRLMEGMLD
jgi:16S rRNA processing protein RimM